MKSLCRFLLAAATLLTSAFVSPSQAQRLPTVSLVADAWRLGPSYPSNQEFLQHSDGWLYGVSRWGGAYGSGTVYRMTLTGSLETLVHFGGSTAGWQYCVPHDTYRSANYASEVLDIRTIQQWCRSRSSPYPGTRRLPVWHYHQRRLG